MTSWNLSGSQGPSLPELHNTIIVAAFEGWNDAGDAASDALEHLDEIWEAAPIVEIDDESYYDYQVNRPVIRQIDGVTLAEDVTGPYDVIVRAQARTIDELGTLVVAQIQAVPGITRTLTCPVINI